MPSYPGLNSFFRLGKNLPQDGASLRAIYNSTAPCAIVTSIFQQINVILHNGFPFPLERDLTANISAVDNDVLYSGIVDAVQHPPCIVEAASEYIREVLHDKEYAAVHWRYNEDDWLKECVEPFPNWCKYLCENIYKIKPVHVAKAIAKTMKSVVSADKNISIYIASPPSIKDFRNDIYIQLQEISKQIIKPTKELKDFLSEKYESCWIESGWKIPEEIESFCEMEIMVHSSWFFFSTLSTWSENIRPLRISVSTENSLRLCQHGPKIYVHCA